MEKEKLIVYSDLAIEIGSEFNPKVMNPTSSKELINDIRYF